MAVVPKQKRSKTRQRNARMHKYLKPVSASLCPACGKPALAHVLCSSCGKYKGEVKLDVGTRARKREKRNKQSKAPASS